MAEKGKKIGFFIKIKNFFLDYKAEIKKIIWPTQKMVVKNTGIVLAMIFVMGIFVAVLDTGFLWSLGKVMDVSASHVQQAEVME